MTEEQVYIISEINEMVDNYMENINKVYGNIICQLEFLKENFHKINGDEYDNRNNHIIVDLEFINLLIKNLIKDIKKLKNIILKIK